MNEKTTVYIDPNLKRNIQIKLLQDGDGTSLSALINQLLEEWYKKNGD